MIDRGMGWGGGGGVMCCPLISLKDTAGRIFKSSNCYAEKLVFEVDMVQFLQNSLLEALSKHDGTKLHSVENMCCGGNDLR